MLATLVSPFVSAGHACRWRTTLRRVLTHRAGQPRFGPEAADLDLLDDSGLRASLAQAAPEYPPGTSLGEHALGEERSHCRRGRLQVDRSEDVRTPRAPRRAARRRMR
nr:beta-lactamase family protein [Streptomyces himastatinicus]